MSRRLDVELTSVREDGTFTWRVVGARQPKGEAAVSLLPAGAGVGDHFRVDADFLIDGIEILSVLPPKAARKEPQRIELKGSGRPTELVTTQLAKKGRGDRRDRGDRGERGDRGDRKGRGDGPRGGQFERRGRSGPGDREGGRPGGEGRGRREGGFRPPPPVRERPKAKRLRARRVHRDLLIASLPPEQQPVAEQVLRGGIPAVRQAIAEQNEKNKAAGLPEVHPAELVALAEQLSPKVKTAEWRDRADAAMADIDELDLRDLRSVVVAADTGAVDDEGRALAASLREALSSRLETEHADWLAEIGELIDAGRSIRALRVSSRPPKAGSPLPPELAGRLAAATLASVDAETTQDRWAALLDALAFSPIRALVKFENLPAEPSAELLSTVRSIAARIPEIATALGVDPSTAPANPRRQQRRSGNAGGAAGKPKRADAAAPAKPAGEQPTPAAAAPKDESAAETAAEAVVEAPAAVEPEAVVESEAVVEPTTAAADEAEATEAAADVEVESVPVETAVEADAAGAEPVVEAAPTEPQATEAAAEAETGEAEAGEVEVGEADTAASEPAADAE